MIELVPDLPALLERYRRGAEFLAVVLTGVFGEEEDFTPDPKKWSIRQIAAHLADSELVAAQRFRRVIAEDDPALTGFDQEAWVRHLDYPRRKPKQSLESFRRVRAETYELLKAIPESAYARAGNHTGRGRLTLLELLEGYAEHAESHARQIQQLREAYKEAKGKK